MQKKSTLSKLPATPSASKTLAEVVEHSESIQDMVQVCADELSSVNTVFKDELLVTDATATIQDAMQKNSTVENQVQMAVDELAIVNNALKAEVKEREFIELAFANANIEKDMATQASLHDPLTGLPNRTLFYDRLSHGLEQAKRHHWQLAVMFIDLDKFKQINDALGHDVGDAVLRTIAERLKKTTRSDDTICRFGGDEFLYLVSALKNEHEVVSMMKKLIKNIALPCEVAGHVLHVNASIGVAIYPKHADEAGELIKLADAAMYVAKQDATGYALALA